MLFWRDYLKQRLICICPPLSICAVPSSQYELVYNDQSVDRYERNCQQYTSATCSKPQIEQNLRARRTSRNRSYTPYQIDDLRLYTRSILYSAEAGVNSCEADCENAALALYYVYKLVNLEERRESRFRVWRTSSKEPVFREDCHGVKEEYGDCILFSSCRVSRL